MYIRLRYPRDVNLLPSQEHVQYFCMEISSSEEQKMRKRQY